MRGSYVIPAVFLLILRSPYVDAAPNVAQYQLDESCGKTAREWFKEEWGNGFADKNGTRMMATYSNHYNRKINVCLLLLRTTVLGQNVTSVMIFDVNEQKDYGECNAVEDSILGCYVGARQCKSFEEWQKLTDALMTE